MPSGKGGMGRDGLQSQALLGEILDKVLGRGRAGGIHDAVRKARGVIALMFQLYSLEYNRADQPAFTFFFPAGFCSSRLCDGWTIVG